jgi:hypothetical protein
MDSQQGHLGAPDGNGVQNLELPETVKQEIEAAAEYTHVPIGDIEVRVKPQRKWRMSDLRMLRAGDFDGWVESVIHPEDIDAFVEQDPTMEQFERFTEDAARLAGDSLGKSSGRSRSSRPTPRR